MVANGLQQKPEVVTLISRNICREGQRYGQTKPKNFTGPSQLTFYQAKLFPVYICIPFICNSCVIIHRQISLAKYNP